MKATQYKVTYSKHGAESVGVFGSIADIAKIQSSGFKVLKILPQVVIDQLPSAEVIDQIKLEFRFELKRIAIKAIEEKLLESEKQTNKLRNMLSIEYLKGRAK